MTRSWQALYLTRMKWAEIRNGDIWLCSQFVISRTFRSSDQIEKIYFLDVRIDVYQSTLNEEAIAFFYMIFYYMMIINCKCKMQIQLSCRFRDLNCTVTRYIILSLTRTEATEATWLMVERYSAKIDKDLRPHCIISIFAVLSHRYEQSAVLSPNRLRLYCSM